MIKPSKKLALQRATLRNLDLPAVLAVHGGIIMTRIGCPTATSTVCTRDDCPTMQCA